MTTDVAQLCARVGMAAAAAVRKRGTADRAHGHAPRTARRDSARLHDGRSEQRKGWPQGALAPADWRKAAGTLAVNARRASEALRRAADVEQRALRAAQLRPKTCDRCKLAGAQ